MPTRTISEIILKKIDETKKKEYVKEFVKEILEIERQHMLTGYPRFSEDYDKIISKHLAIRGKE